MESASTNSDYVFRFDHALEPVVFGNELNISGWLLHRQGEPIHGLRALVRQHFGRREIFRGRRKRNRPDVAATFPDLPDAATSGFLLELQLRLGRNHLSFQVLDHERRWRTFATAQITAVPLSFLDRVGLTNTRTLTLDFLRKRSASRTAEAAPAGLARLDARLPEDVLGQRVDLFATSKSNLFMVEIGQLVAAGFRELGCEATLHIDRVPVENPPARTMQIVVAPHEYHTLFLTQQFSRERILALTRSVYLLCTEQPETGWFQTSLQWAGHSLGVADINPLGVAAYRAQGIPARPLGLGYHPLLPHSQTERSYDITFLGSLTPRREEFLAQHAEFFSRHRCHLRLVPLEFAKTEESRSYLRSEKRNELLSQSRILLNLHHGEQKYFEWHRVLLGLANGCCVITETCQGYGRLVPNEHFVMVEPENLIMACQYFLQHPDEREKIAQAGRKFIETELRQSQLCAEFLRALQEGNDNAFPLELPRDQPAVPLPSALQKTISRHKRQLFTRALAEDFRKLAAEPNAAREELPTPIPDSRTAIIDQREAYRARFLEQGAAKARGESVLEFHDNAAFSALKDPALSVVVTLFNYGQHIEEWVASIARAAERLSHLPELIIINDASTDDSLIRALMLQTNSKLPLRVVDKKFNTGLADARNLGIEIARAPYLFMMDADNLVYPDALRQLLETITTENSDAAFSLLCRFRGNPDNRIGLLSYFDWDPQILIQYPYIDAMALFRRDVLQQLGGYDNELNQIGWFGWEDYDLWLRFAQLNLPVAFIANTLCLYRDHATSMINTTSLFAPELVRHFAERYRDVVKRFEPRARIFGVEREKVWPVAEAKVADKLALS